MDAVRSVSGVPMVQRATESRVIPPPKPRATSGDTTATAALAVPAPAGGAEATSQSVQAQSQDLLAPVSVRRLQPVVNGIAEISQAPIRPIALRSPEDQIHRIIAFANILLAPVAGAGDPGPGGGGPP